MQAIGAEVGNLSSALHRNTAIAVKFDLVGPLLARWQSRHQRRLVEWLGLCVPTLDAAKLFRLVATSGWLGPRALSQIAAKSCHRVRGGQDWRCGRWPAQRHAREPHRIGHHAGGIARRLRGVFLTAIEGEAREIEGAFCEAIRIAKEQK
jgi:hypothetical protein